jgi:hypothetical protein
MLTKISFYITLILIRLNVLKAQFITAKKNINRKEIGESLAKKIHFLVPAGQNEAGAKVIIYDVYPELIKLAKKLKLPWLISVSPYEPKNKVDLLICFKCLPKEQIKGTRKTILLICDQAELFWRHIKSFDYIVATSSEAFASLVSQKNRNTFFISESESIQNLKIGEKNLKIPPSKRKPSILWHGGKYSMNALTQLRPLLESFAERNKFKLVIISGNENKVKYSWGKIEVEQFPWSNKTLVNQVSKARLGIIPARKSLRVSFLKPASRIRLLYALGTPAIGDGRVPDVNKFMGDFKGPVATLDNEWLHQLEKLWESKELDKIAVKGWRSVNQGYSTRQTAIQWVNTLQEII